MALSYEQWLQQVYPTTPYAIASEGQFSGAKAQEMYGQYQNAQAGADPMWLLRDMGGTTQRLEDVATGQTSRIYEAPQDAGAAAYQQNMASELGQLGTVYSESDYGNPGSSFWQNRYSADTPWQRVVSENQNLHTLENLYKSGYFDRFSNFDAAAGDQLGNIVAGLQSAESDSRHQNDRYMGSILAAIAGGVLGAAYAPADSAAAGGTGATSGGAAAPAGVTYGTAAGDAATIYGTGTATGGGSAGIAGTAGTAGTGAALEGAGDMFGPGGAYEAGAAELGGGSALGGAGALRSGAAGASALSSASSLGGGGSGGGGYGGESATSGGLGDSWLTSDDEWLKMLMRGAPGLLGALGSASQAEDFEDLANQYSNMGAPYRSRLQELYGNPQAFLNSPEVRVPIQQGTDMLARSLSVKGNPAGSGNALQELQNYTSNQLFSRLGQEKDRLGGFGGLTQYNQAAPQMAQSALAAQGNIYGDLGGAAADIFNPPRRYRLEDLLRAY